MVDVTIVNNSGQAVALRIDDSTVRGQEQIEHYKKMARQGDFESVKVAPARADKPADKPADDGVPEGSAAEVMAWVGDDRNRAVAAYNAEADKGEAARKTLLTSLEKLTNEMDKR